METPLPGSPKGRNWGLPLRRWAISWLGLHGSEPDSTLTFFFGFPPSVPQWKCVEKVTPIIRVIFIVFQILQTIR